MKKTTILITALIMLFVGAPQAKAVPMYYTFEGTVTGLPDPTGFISDQFPGLAIGDLLTYTIAIDFDVLGYFITNDGTTTITYDLGVYDYYYADAYSGDYLVSTDGGYYNADGDVAEYNYGYDYLLPNGGALSANSQNDKMYIFASSAFSTFANMPVNTSGFLGTNTVFNAGGDSSVIYSSLKLISKSSSPPVSVPEPSTLLLLGSGLLALGMFRRVRQEG